MLAVVAPQTEALSSPTAYVPVLLTLLVINALVLWRRYRSRRQLIARVEELETLSQAGAAMLLAQPDFATLCDLIVSETNKVIDTQTFQLGFFEDNFYHIQSWMINGEPQPPQSFDLSENGGLVGWVRDHREPLIIQDLLVDDDLPARPRYISDSPPRSALFIPLMAQEQVIGLLAAQSQIPNRFDPRHIRQLMILANQAAAAISNSRLFAQERQRAAQVELIGTITHQVNELDDLEEIFDRVVDLTKETFDFYQVNIFVRHPSENQLLLRASSNRPLLKQEIRFSFDEGVVGRAVSLQKTIIANEAQKDERCKASIGIPEADASWAAVRAVMVAPLIVHKKVWGVIEVLSDKVDMFKGKSKKC